MSDIKRTWTSKDKHSAVGQQWVRQGLAVAESHITTRPTFHSGALDLPEERSIMKESPPLQLATSEHASTLYLCLGPMIQTCLDLLQPPASFQL